MALYRTLRDTYGHDTPEEKLKILRHEMITPIAAVRGCAALLEKMGSEANRTDPQSFRSCVQLLKQAGEQLNDALEALTELRDRSEL